jgi:hypothetical protein
MMVLFDFACLFVCPGVVPSPSTASKTLGVYWAMEFVEFIPKLTTWRQSNWTLRGMEIGSEQHLLSSIA